MKPPACNRPIKMFSSHHPAKCGKPAVAKFEFTARSFEATTLYACEEHKNDRIPWEPL